MKIAAIAAVALLAAGCNAPKAGGKCGHSPVKAGPDQKVQLKWTSNAWRVKLNGGPEEDPKTATTKLDECIGPTKFVVDIQNSTPATFKDSDGLAVWEGADKKSEPKSGINSDQILGPAVTKNGKQLVFWDRNQGAGVILNYALHFNESGFPSVDPIIDNGGGD